MEGQAAFIAVDWGTTNARFWLCDRDGGVLAEAGGLGVAALRIDRKFAEEFAKATSGWPENVPAVLCGTIGANIGWHQVGYRALPASLDELSQNTLHFVEGRRPIAILAGVSGKGSFGQLDLMRGEDIQLAGVIADGHGDGIYVLPGTHNKWVQVRDRAIVSFHTAMTGELYAAIAGNTILLTSAATPPLVGEAFNNGAKLALSHADAGLASLLFTVRTRQVLGEMSEADAASYLSGVMIGADVAGGAAQFGEATRSAPITLVGGSSLAASYARACELAGIATSAIAGDAAVLRGLTLAFRQLF